jgi:outer membrane protein, multidrug efflux system
MRPTLPVPLLAWRRDSALTLAVFALLASGCALNTPPRSVSTSVPAQWLAPLPAAQATPALPHGGRVSELSDWWAQQGDPLLAELVAAAQAVNPTVASARSRIEQARAAQTASGAALLPTLDAQAAASRSRAQPFGPGSAPIASVAQLGLQTAWEIDVFGRNRAGLDAAGERLAASGALWHDARVSVAAEVASRYYSYGSCRALEAITRADATSRLETARLTDLSANAGFTAPATAALGRASAAEANARLTEQAAACELDIKALVALSGLSEPFLKQKLVAAQAGRAQAAPITIASVPAQMLAQRPDVFSAAREVAAASDEIGSAEAERYPRLTLSGSVAVARGQSSGVSAGFDTWSIGPLAVTLPLFDGGRRAANVDLAKARYDAAAASLRASVRQAVREVEEALVNLQSSADRDGDAQRAVAGYQASLAGTEALYKNGLASLIDLEDGRRRLLAAQTTLALLQQTRNIATVTLYRALGGGWTPDLASPAAASTAAAAANSFDAARAR